MLRATGRWSTTSWSGLYFIIWQAPWAVPAIKKFPQSAQKLPFAKYFQWQLKDFLRFLCHDGTRKQETRKRQQEWNQKKAKMLTSSRIHFATKPRKHKSKNTRWHEGMGCHNYDKSFIDQSSSVKIGDYWPCSLFAFLWISTLSWSIKRKRELGQYPAIVTSHLVNNTYVWTGTMELP